MGDSTPLKPNRWMSDLHWVRDSQQTRGEETQSKLLDSAEALFGERGVDKTSVADIAEHAGCSIGAVYHHFSDKKAVLYAVFDRLSADFESVTKAAIDPARWEGAAVADIVLGYMQFSLGAAARLPGKPPGVEIARYDPALGAQHVELRMAVDRGLTDLLLARRDEIEHPNPELAVKFILEQLGSMMRIRLNGASIATRFGDQSDEDFVIEATRSVCSYLQVEPPTDA